MDADITALAGWTGKHDPARTAVRHGRERGSVTLGGLFTSTEVVGRMAMEKMLAGLSTRRYPIGLESV